MIMGPSSSMRQQYEVPTKPEDKEAFNQRKWVLRCSLFSIVLRNLLALLIGHEINCISCWSGPGKLHLACQYVMSIHSWSFFIRSLSKKLVSYFDWYLWCSGRSISSWEKSHNSETERSSMWSPYWPVLPRRRIPFQYFSKSTLKNCKRYVHIVLDIWRNLYPLILLKSFGLTGTFPFTNPAPHLKDG